MGGDLSRLHNNTDSGKSAFASLITRELTLRSKLALVFESVYGPFIWFIKLSLSLLYVQIFRPLRWLRYLAYSGALVTGLFYFAIMIAFSVLCSPTQGHSKLAYLSTLESTRCRDTNSMIIALGAVSFISDLYLVILPMPAVWNLQLPFRKKMAVSAMFFTGSVYVLVEICNNLG